MKESAFTDRAGALDASERVRLMRDGLVNNSGAVVSVVVGIVLVPIMLHGLGTESYSLWIAALAVLGMPAGLDFGLGATVVREVAARGREASMESAALLQAAGSAYLVYGILGGLVITALGLPLSRGLHLSPSLQQAAPRVLALTGFVFFAEQQMALASATLQGMQRFDMVNLLSAAAALLRAAGIVVLLEAGHALKALMAWYALAGLGVAVGGFVLIARLDSSLRYRPGWLRWSSLRRHISFALASQMIRIFIQVIWESGPLLIGLVLGSVWIVPYYIGEKFPATAVGATWRVAEVFFPAASQDDRTRNVQRTREIIELGTRWIAALAIPVCLVFWTLGPELLRAWVREASPDAVHVLWLMTGVLLADALGLSALSILWGYGKARPLAGVLGIVALSTVTLSVALLKPVGVSAVAWAMLISIFAGSMVFLNRVCKMCGLGVLELMGESYRGLLLPSLFGGAVAVSLPRVVPLHGWPELVGATMAILSAYALGFLLIGARPEERELARQIGRAPFLGLRAALKSVRGLFGGPGPGGH
jgi:O-antigen/teichoic acid export membrane protein